MRRIRTMWRVLTLMVVLVLALMSAVPTGARPSKPTEPARSYTHTVTVDGSRITSTLTFVPEHLVDWLTIYGVIEAGDSG